MLPLPAIFWVYFDGLLVITAEWWQWNAAAKSGGWWYSSLKDGLCNATSTVTTAKQERERERERERESTKAIRRCDGFIFSVNWPDCLLIPVVYMARGGRQQACDEGLRGRLDVQRHRVRRGSFVLLSGVRPQTQHKLRLLDQVLL